MNTLLSSLNIKLLHVGYAKLGKQWDYNNVISPFTRMIYVTKGNALINHTNQTFNLKPKHIYLVPSYVYNWYKCDIYHEQFYLGFFEEVEYGISIYNFKDFIYEVEATESDIEYFKRLLKINPDMAVSNSVPKAHILNHFKEKENTKNESLFKDYYLETKGIISILLSRFIKNTNTSKKTDLFKGDFNKVIIYIAQHLHQDISVEKLATFCNLNTDYFSRVFKETFEIRPNKYIQQKRIERAQLLLLTTFNSVEQIAEQVGFKNVSYFSRTFKKLSKKSPGAFREEQLNI